MTTSGALSVTTDSLTPRALSFADSSVLGSYTLYSTFHFAVLYDHIAYIKRMLNHRRKESFQKIERKRLKSKK